MTKAQSEMLKTIGAKPVVELFAPNTATLRALKRMGLINFGFLGQRWWQAALTKQGRETLHQMEQKAL